MRKARLQGVLVETVWVTATVTVMGVGVVEVLSPDPYNAFLAGALTMATIATLLQVRNNNAKG